MWDSYGPSICVLHTERRTRGLACSRNRGVEGRSTDYFIHLSTIACLDADISQPRPFDGPSLFWEHTALLCLAIIMSQPAISKTFESIDVNSLPAAQNDEPEAGPLWDLPGFERDLLGRPIIGRDAQSLYAFGHLIRATEQFLLDQFSRGLVSGTTHTCIGQEFCAMAVVRALTHADDVVLSNHRNHGHFLAYSGNFLGLTAEIMGRKQGVCGGRGGSQHLAYKHFHSNGVQGGMTGLGVGMALARKRRGSQAVVAAMVGDGTLGEGLLYESMNLAAIWHVPMLFVIENNGIAQTTYTVDTIGGSIAARGAAFGLETWQLSDEHPALFEQAEAAVDWVRQNQRPGFLIIDTKRLGPHSKGDDLRPEAEKSAIQLRDPLDQLGRQLPDATRAAIEARNTRFLDQVAEAANNSPEAIETAPPQDIFAHSARLPAVPHPEVPPGSNVRQAINIALRHLLEQDDKTLLLGEDLHDPYGGAFKVTEGLSTDFPGRVISTPISEAGVTGASIGLAMEDRRPVMEVMFADFLTLCMDQLYNHAVKFPGVFPGTTLPLVIRTPSGGRRGYGPTHSQSPENIFTSVPGLTVVYPSHRHDVAGLLVDATQRWPYPTLFMEHKLLYGEKQDRADYRVLPAVPGDVAADLFPTLVRGDEAPDLTLISYGGMLPVVEQVARILAEQEELAVEIVVPALLAPLPRATLLSHLLNRPRIVIIEEAHTEFGISAEIMATLLESGFSGQATRMGTPPVPISAARSLERQIIPDVQQLVEDILDLF